MFKFSKLSKSRLDTCHADLITLFNYVIRFWDCSVFCGFRPDKEQQEAFNSGASKKRPGASTHNRKPSEGVDVAPYPFKLKNGSDDTQKVYMFAGFVLGIAEWLFETGQIKHKIRCGADWNSNRDINDQNFNDLLHYEIIKNKGEK